MHLLRNTWMFIKYYIILAAAENQSKVLLLTELQKAFKRYSAEIEDRTMDLYTTVPFVTVYRFT